MPNNPPSSEPQPEQKKGPRAYVATLALLSIMAGVFVVEFLVWSAGYGGPEFGSTSKEFGADLLRKLGGLSRPLVLRDGQWWRFVVSPLLHGGLLHLLLNSLALFIVGPRLEGIVGATWFCAIFAVSCFSGDLFSLLINDPRTVSVGASGGIMGLFATALLVSYRLEESEDRTRLQTGIARMLIPTLMPALLIPIAGGAQDGVDVAAHLGGALAGFGCGMYLFVRSDEPNGLKRLHDREPRDRP